LIISVYLERELTDRDKEGYTIFVYLFSG